MAEFTKNKNRNRPTTPHFLHHYVPFNLIALPLFFPLPLSDSKMANPTSKVTPLFVLSLLQTILYFYLLSFSLFQHSTLAKSNTYNVVDFGAKPDGKTDSTKAFLLAWNKACGSPKPSSIYVPQGKFLVGTATFSGQCANKAISITIDGTLVAPSYYGYDARYWLTFDQVSGVSIHGGLLDGQGSSLWDCKNSGKTKCPIGAAVCYCFIDFIRCVWCQDTCRC